VLSYPSGMTVSNRARRSADSAGPVPTRAAVPPGGPSPPSTEVQGVGRVVGNAKISTRLQYVDGFVMFCRNPSHHTSECARRSSGVGVLRAACYRIRVGARCHE
jgi:hypothetical protein